MPYTKLTIDENYFTGVMNQQANAPSLPVVQKFTQKATFNGSKTGTKLQGWKQVIRSGSNASTVYSSDRARLDAYSPGKSSLVYGRPGIPLAGGKEIHTGCSVYVGNSFNHLSTNAANVEADALSKLYKRIRAERSPFNGMTFLGELREAVHMIRSPAQALLKEVNSYVNSLEKEKRRILKLPIKKRRAQWEKAIAGSTLEMNFGWRPFIADLDNAAKALAQHMVEPPKRTRIRAQASSEAVQTSISENLAYGIPSAYTYFNVVCKQTTTRTVRYITGHEWAVASANGALSRLAGNLGFSIENFVPTIYELTPWSWLADYFSNLGDIIEAATTDLTSLKWVVRNETVKTVTEYSSLISSKRHAALAAEGAVIMSASGHGGSVRFVRTTFQRTMPPLGLPPLVFTHPGESFTKMANLVSVIMQRRKGLEDLSHMPSYGSKSEHFL